VPLDLRSITLSELRWSALDGKYLLAVLGVRPPHG
jgi:hypothetical protein